MRYVERYLNSTIQYSGRQKLSSIKVDYVNILTALAFWLAFFGLDASRIVGFIHLVGIKYWLMWLWFWKVYHKTYTTKFIFNILFRIVVWTYLFVTPQFVIHLVVCSVSKWLVVCSVCFIFCTFPHIVFCSYLSLTQPVFVSTYLY